MSEVRFTVNGAPVVLDVEPRLTLADALRHRLGLTGTHVGCEHGVCGACTVLLDGAAVRSCLTFCVQLQNAQVTTVEALGEPGELHPLQAAFARHHALQCGFCTPGFLMSACELLSRPDAGALADDERRLRQELSGVLCRCTGYAGIVAAVREIAAAYPQGLPAPAPPAMAPSAMAPSVRQRVPPAGELSALSAARARAREPAQRPDGAPHEQARRRLSVPAQDPNETIELASPLQVDPDSVWELLCDFPRMARCMPGVELDAGEQEDRYSGRVSVGVGFVRLRLAGEAQVLQRDHQARRMRALVEGRDLSGGQLAAEVELTAGVGESAEQTELRILARLYLSGRLAQFGRSLAGDISRGLFEQFVQCLEQTALGVRPPAASRVGAAAMLLSLARSRLAAPRRALRRLLARRR